MPLRMDISRLNRMVLIVARGQIAAEEIETTAKALVEADVPGYAKIIDISQATSELTPDQIEKVAALLHGGQGARGPVAFVINPERIGFANAFADITKDERPIRLFRSIHEARTWLDQSRLEGLYLPTRRPS